MKKKLFWFVVATIYFVCFIVLCCLMLISIISLWKGDTAVVEDIREIILLTPVCMGGALLSIYCYWFHTD